jgi:molybdopterin converting factor small subunit
MARPFFETLRELRGGATLEELTSALAELVQAVRASDKAGELILKLRVRPPRKGTATYLTVEDIVTVKKPVMDRGDTVFFPTVEGGLSRQDPNQGRLDLRGVDTSTGEIGGEAIHG